MSDEVRAQQIQHVGLHSYRTVSLVSYHFHSPKGSLSKQEPGEDINKSMHMSHLEDDMTHSAGLQSVPDTWGRRSCGKTTGLVLLTITFNITLNVVKLQIHVLSAPCAQNPHTDKDHPWQVYDYLISQKENKTVWFSKKKNPINVLLTVP